MDPIFYFYFFGFPRFMEDNRYKLQMTDIKFKSACVIVRLDGIMVGELRHRDCSSRHQNYFSSKDYRLLKEN